jgi:hypothetical protein
MPDEEPNSSSKPPRVGERVEATIALVRSWWIVSLCVAVIGALTIANRGWEQAAIMWAHLAGVFSVPPTPAFTVSGQIVLTGAPDLPGGAPTVKVFWIKPGADDKTDPSLLLDMLIQSPEYARTDKDNNGLTYELHLNERPPSEAIDSRYSAPGHLGYDVARGFVVAFIDVGKDAIFNRGPDKIISVSTTRMVLWRKPYSTQTHPANGADDDYRFTQLMHNGYCLADETTTGGGPFECIAGTMAGGEISLPVGDEQLKLFELLRKANQERHHLAPPTSP